MRLGCILIAAGLLAACGQEREAAPAEAPAAAPAPTEPSELSSALEEEPAPLPADDVDYQTLSGYDSTWYVSAGWPGSIRPDLPFWMQVSARPPGPYRMAIARLMPAAPCRNMPITSSGTLSAWRATTSASSSRPRHSR